MSLKSGYFFLNMIIEHQGIPVYFSSKGHGKPLVLLHGFLESSKIWDPYLEELAAKRRVICIDLPGHGNTGIFGEVHSMELMAQVVNIVLEELNISRATIIGHSMGGYVSLAFAELYPEKISGVVLMNSVPVADTEEKRINRDKSAKLVAKNKSAYIKMAIQNLVALGNEIIFKDELERLEREVQKFPAEGIIANLKGMKIRTDRIKALKQLTSYKLMICGTEDPIMPLKSIESLGKLCECPVISINGGHLSHIENFAAVREIMHYID